jgi:hypothetical protein
LINKRKNRKKTQRLEAKLGARCTSVLSDGEKGTQSPCSMFIYIPKYQEVSPKVRIKGDYLHS